jgi:hypothetical protein
VRDFHRLCEWCTPRGLRKTTIVNPVYKPTQGFVVILKGLTNRKAPPYEYQNSQIRCETSNKTQSASDKKLDLGNDLGKQIVLSETKLVLRTHAKTFKKLADM